MRKQRYVSTELAHFVGRDLLGDTAGQYARLKKILSECQLRPGGLDEDPGLAMWSSFGNSTLCNEDMFEPPVVCFCDIPPDDLGLHVSKYGPFGISFDKKWLIMQGANPVFYLAAGDSPVRDGSDTPRMRGEYFTREIEALQEALARFDDRMESTHESDDHPGIELHDKVEHIFNFFLTYQVFSYFKCFDPLVSEDDDRAYYLEREWRVLGSLSFSLPDVVRVVLPPEFAEQFRADFPAYPGQISFEKNE